MYQHCYQLMPWLFMSYLFFATNSNQVKSLLLTSNQIETDGSIPNPKTIFRGCVGGGGKDPVH